MGAAREKFVKPKIGKTAGSIVMTLAFIAVVFLVAAIMADTAGLTDDEALGAGVIWFVLTVAWEIFMGRVLMKLTWREVFADYNIFRGRLWPLVLLATLIAPYLMN
jgi:hypothetical protein